MARSRDTATKEVNSTATSMASSPNTDRGAGPLLTFGGWSGVIGALLAFVANGLHPHPSDFNLEALLHDIAQSTTWGIVHLALVVSLFLILGALVTVTLTIHVEPSATIARFACVAALLGGALIFVSTAADGFAMNLLARTWLDAPPTEKAVALRIADAFEIAQYAVYSLSVVFLLGIGIFLYGLATILSSTYPKALGGVATLSGAGAFVVGVVQVLSGPQFRGTEIFFVLFSMLSTLYVGLMGVVMWRRASSRDAKTA